MTSLIQNDVTGKSVASSDSVKVQIYYRGTKIHKEFDCELQDIRPLMSAKGVRSIDFFKLSKDDKGQWQRLTVEDPEQKKIEA